MFNVELYNKIENLGKNLIFYIGRFEGRIRFDYLRLPTRPALGVGSGVCELARRSDRVRIEKILISRSDPEFDQV